MPESKIHLDPALRTLLNALPPVEGVTEQAISCAVVADRTGLSYAVAWTGLKLLQDKKLVHRHWHVWNRTVLGDKVCKGES